MNKPHFTFRKLINKTNEIVRSAAMDRSISNNLPDNLMPFMIISAPRSGSNLLCGLINSHPEILCFYEMFHNKAIHYGPNNYEKYDFGTMTDRNSDPVAFLSKIYSLSHGYKAVGIKMFNNHNNIVLRAMITNRKIKKIVLRRKAALHSYTSLMIARMNNDYILLQGKAPEKQNRIDIDVESFKTYVGNMDYFYNKTKKLIGSQLFIDLDYTDIVKETEQYNKIISFIGVDNHFSLKAITKKQNVSGLQDKIRNYDEVAQSLTNTKYEKYLQEELA